jgi:hypothetical protein
MSPAYFFHSKSVVCDKKIKPSSDARVLAFSCNNQNALGHGSKNLSTEQFFGLFFFKRLNINFFKKIIEFG